MQSPTATISLAEIDLDWVDIVRKRIPIALHRRPELYAAATPVSVASGTPPYHP